MHSMTEEARRVVIGGVDAHADAHHYAPLDGLGVLLGHKAFPATMRGYAGAVKWLGGFGELDAIAVESTGSYAAGLVRYLRRHNIHVREVNQRHAHSRRRVGKSDPIDAEMAARLLLAGKATAIPKRTDGIVEAIRTLRAARNSAVEGPHDRDGPDSRPHHHRSCPRCATNSPIARPCAGKLPTRPTSSTTTAST
jgi:hypothetical protein